MSTYGGNMQETGKRRFNKFIEEKKKNLILYTTVWICLLVIGVLIGFADILIMIVFMVFGVTLGYLNIKSWIQYKRTIDSIGDLEKLYVQLENIDANQFEEWKLMITDEYVLSAYDNFLIIPFTDIEKVEIVIQESGLKPNQSIEITGKDNSEKYRIAQVYTVNNSSIEFYKAFELIQRNITQK